MNSGATSSNCSRKMQAEREYLRWTTAALAVCPRLRDPQMVLAEIREYFGDLTEQIVPIGTVHFRQIQTIPAIAAGFFNHARPDARNGLQHRVEARIEEK